MPPLHQLSTAQLRQALQLSEQIDTMQRKLEAILGGPEPTESGATRTKGARGRGGKRTMSAEGREKIAAAARARWAKVKAGSGKPAASAVTAAKPGKVKAVAAKAGRVAKKPAVPAAAAPKKRGKLTDEGRAKLAAAMKARWEARKKSAPDAAV